MTVHIHKQDPECTKSRVSEHRRQQAEAASSEQPAPLQVVVHKKVPTPGVVYHTEPHTKTVIVNTHRSPGVVYHSEPQPSPVVVLHDHDHGMHAVMSHDAGAAIVVASSMDSSMEGSNDPIQSHHVSKANALTSAALSSHTLGDGALKTIHLSRPEDVYTHPATSSEEPPSVMEHMREGEAAPPGVHVPHYHVNPAAVSAPELRLHHLGRPLDRFVHPGSGYEPAFATALERSHSEDMSEETGDQGGGGANPCGACGGGVCEGCAGRGFCTGCVGLGCTVCDVTGKCHGCHGHGCTGCKTVILRPTSKKAPTAFEQYHYGIGAKPGHEVPFRVPPVVLPPATFLADDGMRPMEVHRDNTTQSGGGSASGPYGGPVNIYGGLNAPPPPSGGGSGFQIPAYGGGTNVGGYMGGAVAHGGPSSGGGGGAPHGGYGPPRNGTACQNTPHKGYTGSGQPTMVGGHQPNISTVGYAAGGYSGTRGTHENRQPSHPKTVNSLHVAR